MHVGENCPEYKIVTGTLNAVKINDNGSYAHKLAKSNLEIPKEILETAKITEAKISELSCNLTKIEELDASNYTQGIISGVIAPTNITFDLELYDVNIETKNNQLRITYSRKDDKNEY